MKSAARIPQPEGWGSFTSATVHVTLARIGSTPIHKSVGNVTSVPPPATEFIIPAIKAVKKTRDPCQTLTVAD